MNVQDVFLNQLRKEKARVEVELLGGGRCSGLVKGFDNFCILFQTAEGASCLLYKHALSRITAPREFVLHSGEREPFRKP